MGWIMRITIQPSADNGAESVVDLRLQRAFKVLHEAHIGTRGGGRFADASTAIVLPRETDVAAALAALNHLGASVLVRERSGSERLTNSGLRSISRVGTGSSPLDQR
jgi:hypothetical protein